MKILVTGKNGQLGQSLQKIVGAMGDSSQSANDYIFIGRDELDLRSQDGIDSYFSRKFDIIINCAAYTSVDRAENDKKEANIINYLAVKKLAEIAKRNNIRLIHISTDFVFDGLSLKPYSESDTPSPLNIYGKTKLKGEKAILSIMKFNAIIIRTSWLYSEYGNNFVDTILKLAQKNSNLNVVSDQVGTPTYASDLAEVILTILKSDKFISKDWSSVVYHYSNEGQCSWYEFAKEILNISGSRCNIQPINTEEYPTPAKRPKYVLMSKKKLIDELDLEINLWQDSLKYCIKNLSSTSPLINK